MMLEDRLRRYASLSVPRYTSYPTAVDFSGAVLPQDYALWLGGIDSSDAISLYLHVPYCRDLCYYCGCHAKAARRDDVIDAYRATLEAEIAQVLGRVRAPLRIKRIHWGGGTPTMLGAEGLASVLRVLQTHCVFEEGFEHAIELDPRSVDQSMAQALANLGINRASLGVQDVDHQVQIAIGRVQPLSLVEAAARHLRAAGVARLNFDLIYGLPHQTPHSLTQTCAAIAALNPDRIACYGYAHLPQRRANQRLIDERALPTSDGRLELAQTMSAAFLVRGFASIGLDHFAKTDDPLAVAAREHRLHRNFQGYTDDDCKILLGFGASAITRLPQGYVQNTADNSLYAKRIASGQLATVRGCRMGAEEHIRAQIIEDLMCNFRTDLKLFGAEIDFSEELALLRPLVADGLLTIDNRVIVMTDIGRPLVRVAASVFDQFRRDETGDFSLAV
jgi:oxygen-independent coproporphyrinogen-3 oxidase